MWEKCSKVQPKMEKEKYKKRCGNSFTNLELAILDIEYFNFVYWNKQNQLNFVCSNKQNRRISYNLSVVVQNSWQCYRLMNKGQRRYLESLEKVVLARNLAVVKN